MFFCYRVIAFACFTVVLVQFVDIARRAIPGISVDAFYVHTIFFFGFENEL